jgi:predicted dehydrogenase
MLNSFRDGKVAETSGEDNLKTYALVEAAYESAMSGNKIKPRI